MLTVESMAGSGVSAHSLDYPLDGKEHGLSQSRRTSSNTLSPPNNLTGAVLDRVITERLRAVDVEFGEAI